VRIAQIAPLYESVPPRLYGGTERIVSYLSDALVELGHEVTLFASSDSITRASLVSTGGAALRLRERAVLDSIAPHVVQLEQVYRRRNEFDVVHFHGGYLHWPVMRHQRVRHMTTMHGRLDLPELRPLFHEFRSMPLVSISDSQRAPVEWANWLGTVYHGLPANLFRQGPGDGDYFAFVGRISPEKRVDRAIEIARRLGVRIRIAAKVDAADRTYFKTTILPLLRDPLVEFLDELDDPQKEELLRGARALLFPIDWPEPFGLVMIEALACGTPVIAFGHGSVPEVIEHGVTGYIVEDIDAAVHAAAAVGQLSRQRCRQVFEERFTARRMAQGYVGLYEKIAPARRKAPPEREERPCLTTTSSRTISTTS
jgi:glycosyltransferase involved in cell wall biosynthesis